MTRPAFRFSEKIPMRVSVAGVRPRGMQRAAPAFRFSKKAAKAARIDFANRQGMSIVEVMVAFAVIAVVAILMIAGFSGVAAMNAHNANRIAVDESLAYGIAIEGVPSGVTSGALALGGASNIPIQAETFGDSDQQYTVFSYEP
jgi:hypothetical protein